MDQIATFALERYFAQHEFSARYLLSASDCEALSLSDLLTLADGETQRLWDDLKLSYTETTGHPLLRQEIAGLYQNIDENDLVVLVPEEGIYLTMHALLRPDDHVVCTFPAYQSLYEVARSIGCRVDTWRPDEGANWRFDPDDLKALLRPDTRLVVANFPHNPTGALPSRADYEAMIEIIDKRGAYLLSDEMYRFLEIDPSATLFSACERYPRAITLFGLSKSFGLPGLRLGWVASQDASVLERIVSLKDYTTICNSAPAEILGIIALRARQTILEQQRRRVRRNLDVLDAFMKRFADRFSWNRPGGGSICFPRMLGVEDTRVFCDRLVEETGIMLVPSDMFQFGPHHVRIGFGRQNLPQVLDRFESYLGRW